MALKLLASEFFADANQNIAIEPRQPQSNYPEHTHNFSEIVVVTSGRGRHIINGYPQELHQGTVLYIKADDFHLYENVENLNLTNLLFQSYDNFKFIKNIGHIIENMRYKNSLHQVNKKTLSELQLLLSQLENCESSLQEENILFQALALLDRSQFNITPKGSNREKAEQVIQYLRNNFADEIEWEKIAQQFDIPIRTLYRHIKNELGCTPQAYLNKLRLAEAYYQLRYTDKNIIDIAYDCGFNDSGYFSTCFKQEFSILPKVMR
ncbi:hypothetical protein A4G18_03270 [Pasteurellaceae bacterium Pebbles2]|nr:hypothetical protein [Pasteurellaceae bacterium Pebbles2]